jgi:hypothetical protein
VDQSACNGMFLLKMDDSPSRKDDLLIE